MQEYTLNSGNDYDIRQLGKMLNEAAVANERNFTTIPGTRSELRARWLLERIEMRVRGAVLEEWLPEAVEK